MLLLGIETSCDDTAAAVVRDGVHVLANVSTNQDAFHAKYGGIVPEIASRRHAALLSAAIDDALTRAGVGLAALDGIAVTSGPGLIGSLVVGVASAKALAFATGLPLYAVNHLHGHLFAPFLERDEPPPYPFLALLVSGGHTQLVDVRSATAMRVIGKTRDDAAGEAFDKTARLLGLPFPGGPGRHARPQDVAASFQAAVVDVLIDRVTRALDANEYCGLVLSGGVAANSALQAAFSALGAQRRIATFIPEARFCTDNAAMIAAAAERRGESARVDPRDLVADPNLPFVAA